MYKDVQVRTPWVASDRNSPETTFKRRKDYGNPGMARKARAAAQSPGSPPPAAGVGLGARAGWGVNAGQRTAVLVGYLLKQEVISVIQVCFKLVKLNCYSLSKYSLAVK